MVTLLVIVALALTIVVHAADPSTPFVLLDEKPKVIFYLSNSHHGNEGLQVYFDHAGFFWKPLPN